jgi:hypothetical protein
VLKCRLETKEEEKEGKGEEEGKSKDSQIRTINKFNFK